ncbi:MAG: hypothetical protein JWO94_2396 [Verrucomicrobiaceae bacterium]|nr:hypothetical protein [Verrucomicrobiaceae bacterium]
MSIATLDMLMTPVADCMDRASLEALVALRADAGSAERIASLASLANEGSLTSEERAEYESCITFASFLGTLQSKARKKLASQS